MNEIALFEQEAAVLRSLLRLALDRPVGTAWQQLERSKGLFTVSATFFLLDVDPLCDVEQFTVHTLDRLLQCLHRRTEQVQVEYEGRVRGRIVWPATYKARYCQDYDPSRYVCREVRHEYDTPENQLVKYVSNRINACLRAVPEVLRTGLCYYPPPRSPLRTAIRLGNIEAALSRFRRNVHMRGITLPQQITEIHLLRANTAKLDEYRTVVRIYKCYQNIVEAPSQEKITEIGKRMLPLPSGTGLNADPWLRLGADILRS